MDKYYTTYYYEARKLTPLEQLVREGEWEEKEYTFTFWAYPDPPDIDIGSVVDKSGNEMTKGWVSHRLDKLKIRAWEHVEMTWLIEESDR